MQNSLLALVFVIALAGVAELVCGKATTQEAHRENSQLKKLAESPVKTKSESEEKEPAESSGSGLDDEAGAGFTKPEESLAFKTVTLVRETKKTSDSIKKSDGKVHKPVVEKKGRPKKQSNVKPDITSATDPKKTTRPSSPGRDSLVQHDSKPNKSADQSADKPTSRIPKETMKSFAGSLVTKTKSSSPVGSTEGVTAKVNPKKSSQNIEDSHGEKSFAEGNVGSVEAKSKTSTDEEDIMSTAEVSGVGIAALEQLAEESSGFSSSISESAAPFKAKNGKAYDTVVAAKVSKSAKSKADATKKVTVSTWVKKMKPKVKKASKKEKVTTMLRTVVGKPILMMFPSGGQEKTETGLEPTASNVTSTPEFVPVPAPAHVPMDRKPEGIPGETLPNKTGIILPSDIPSTCGTLVKQYSDGELTFREYVYAIRRCKSGRSISSLMAEKNQNKMDAFQTWMNIYQTQNNKLASTNQSESIPDAIRQFMDDNSTATTRGPLVGPNPLGISPGLPLQSRPDSESWLYDANWNGDPWQRPYPEMGDMVLQQPFSAVDPSAAAMSSRRGPSSWGMTVGGAPKIWRESGRMMSPLLALYKRHAMKRRSSENHIAQP